MIRPGVRFCDVDAAASDHIAATGYGKNFAHRLGQKPSMKKRKSTKSLLTY